MFYVGVVLSMFYPEIVGVSYMLAPCISFTVIYAHEINCDSKPFEVPVLLSVASSLVMTNESTI